MKKMTLFLLTALVLASVFAGCSASAYMDDPYAGDYSNVSTTRNGTVNGTNGRYTGYGCLFLFFSCLMMVLEYK